MAGQYKRLAVWMAACATVPMLGCRDNGGASLEIVTGVNAEPVACNFLASGQRTPRGAFDPTGAEAYHLGVLLQNHMFAKSDIVIGTDGFESIRMNLNDVQIIGFDACWYLSTPPFGTFGSTGDGRFSCSDVPAAQRAFIPASGFIQEGDNFGVVGISVLTRAHLQALFGAAFDPEAIPSEGVVPRFAPSTSGDQHAGEVFSQNYSFLSEDPSPASPAIRSAAWGTYPATREVEVVVQVRAVGEIASTGRVRSNWFSYPIDLCMGCFQAQCGELNQIVCQADLCVDPLNPSEKVKCQPANCSDGSPCFTSDLCSDGTPCPRALCPDKTTFCDPERPAFLGALPDFRQTCLPFQGIQKAACLTFNGCNDGTLF